MVLGKSTPVETGVWIFSGYGRCARGGQWNGASSGERVQEERGLQTRAAQGQAAASGGQEERQGEKKGAGSEQRFQQAEEGGARGKHEVGGKWVVVEGLEVVFVLNVGLKIEICIQRVQKKLNWS